MRAKIFIILFFLLTGCAQQSSDDMYTLDPEPLPTNTDPKFSKKEHAPLAHIMYKIGKGNFQEAISAILKEKKQNPHLLHTDLLQNVGLAILEHGMRQNTAEDLLACLYAIGISQDERLIAHIARILHIPNPYLQLTALSVLASFETAQADTLLQEAMKSNFLFVRLEAAYILAMKHRPLAYEQLEALMHKLDPEFRPVFPKLFAIEASPHGQRMLKSLLFDNDILVRSEAIMACSDFGRDDVLDEIRSLSSDPHPIQQEACAYALGSFKDHASFEILQKIASNKTSSQAFASLAALWALYQLGDTAATYEIIAYAKAKNLFAIRLLAKIPDTNAFLIQCLQDDDVSVRVNAALALLEKKDPACLSTLATIFLDSPSDYTFQPLYSPGKTLTACKVVASSSALYKNEPLFFELSLRFRESVLQQASELNESDFLTLAKSLMSAPQKDLIPRCISILQNIQSENAITLLKQHASQIGSPLVRAWCALALYRLHVDTSYGEKVRAILSQNDDEDVFLSRPTLPWRMRQDDEPYSLNLQESQRLVIEAYQAFAEAQNDEGIECLLRAICAKNGHIRYAVAGLLMRSSL